MCQLLIRTRLLGRPHFDAPIPGSLGKGLCELKIHFKRTNQGGSEFWELARDKTPVYKHNHVPTARIAIPVARQLNNLQQIDMARLSESGVKETRTSNHPAGHLQLEKAGFEEALGHKAPTQTFLKQLNDDKCFYKYETDANDRLTRVIGAEAGALEKWAAYPTILLIDAPYQTNRYNLPLIQIVGVTATGQSFTCAYIYVSDELEVTYTWVLERLADLMVMTGIPTPEVLLTDRDLALMSACGTVFPGAKHILCIWHINQKVGEKCRKGSLAEGDNWKIFEGLWNNLVSSPTEADYLKRLEALKLVCLVHG